MKQYKHYNENAYKDILKLIEERNQFKAFDRCKIYIENYPNDVNGLITYSTLALEFGYIDEAEKVLYDVKLNNRTTIKATTAYIFAQLKLLLVQRRYEECYNLFLKYYDILKKNLNGYITLEIFLKKKLGLPIPEEAKEYSYKISQIIEYDEKLAIEHISEHKYCKDDKETVFSFDFQIEEFYYKLRDMLPIQEKQLFSNILNLYIVKYTGCGCANGKSLDYIRVITLPDSNDIITMFPIDSNNNLPFIDMTPIKEEKPFVKRMNQIDKFNKKYGL